VCAHAALAVIVRAWVAVEAVDRSVAAVEEHGGACVVDAARLHAFLAEGRALLFEFAAAREADLLALIVIAPRHLAGAQVQDGAVLDLQTTARHVLDLADVVLAGGGRAWVLTAVAVSVFLTAAVER